MLIRNQFDGAQTIFNSRRGNIGGIGPEIDKEVTRFQNEICFSLPPICEFFFFNIYIYYFETLILMLNLFSSLYCVRKTYCRSIQR